MENIQEVTQETIVIEKPQEKKPTKKWNIQGIVGVLILIIIAIVGIQIFNSFVDKSGSPVVGERFKSELTNKITKQHLKQLQEQLKIENVASLEVNLTSATLRINVDTEDNLDIDDIKILLAKEKEILETILPIEQYFTNKNEIKMYDYEIHVFNTVKKTEALPQIYIMSGKTGAGESYEEVLSSPKNEEAAKEVREVKKP